MKWSLLIEKWQLFFLGAFLFLFATTTFGDFLSNGITDYPNAFQKRLKEAQRAFQAEAWREALQLYLRLAEEAPEFPIVHIGMGDAAAKLKDYPIAIAAFQRALQRLSTEPQGDITKLRLQVMVQAKLAAA